MESEREYYIAGGDDLEKALGYLALRRSACDEMNTLAVELGGISSASNGRTMGGVIFDMEEPIQGWTLKGYTSDNEPFYFPRKTTKEGKAIAKRISDLRMPDIRDFHSMYDKNGGVIAGMHPSGRGQRVLYISWEYVGDTLLLTVPIGSGYQPNGSRRLKMSEYWAMKEALLVAA